MQIACAECLFSSLTQKKLYRIQKRNELTTFAQQLSKGCSLPLMLSPHRTKRFFTLTLLCDRKVKKRAALYNKVAWFTKQSISRATKKY